MLRNLAAALALTLLSQMVMALGLGSIKPSSRLNEPFDGRIEILGMTAADVDSIFVKLADAEQYERAGVARDAVLLQLKFSIVEGKSGADYVQISSHEPIREPFLNFLIELNWANGRMVREYTVLLDPPLYDPVRRRAPTATRVAEQPVMKTEALAPAPSPPAGSTVSQPPATMPVETSVERDAEPTTYSPQSSLGPVQTNDTLWSIASANLPDGSTSVQQMMLALLRANADAFGDGNINVLKRGAILRLPDPDDIGSLTRAEAMAEVQQQNQLWANYRDSVANRVAQEPAMQESAPEQDSLTATDMDADELGDSVQEETPEVTTPSDGRLELVAPQAEDGKVGAGGDGVADVTLVREELDAQVQENDELRARIAEANEIIDLMSRQVDIKDDELAALQRRLAELGIEAPAQEDSADPHSEMDDDATADTEPSDEVTLASPDEVDDVDISIGNEPATDPSDVVADSGDTTSDVEQNEVVPKADDVVTESIFSGIIPQHIASMVPGGAVTVLGLIGAALLALLAIIIKLVRGGRENDEQTGVRTVSDDVTELTEVPEDEPITETPVLLVDDDLASEATTQYDPALQETSPDLLRTLQSSAEALAGEVVEEDPLEEVNVYLAYERFDQAEELVRNVIAEHPNEHNYKLRLLEVFYSSNNKSAYETAARDLHEHVGDANPLWDSAVAMWTEMSPERELFAERVAGEDDVPSAVGASNAIVDITADTDAGITTLSMTPGIDEVLESTQVGLGDAEDEAGDLDFDLGSADFDISDNDFLDLTATTDSLLGSEILDLTASVDAGDFGIGAIESNELPSGDDVLDITSSGPLSADELLDITAGSHEPDNLLDVTRTGISGLDEGEDILNVTSPNLQSGDLSLDDAMIDFDISDTVAPLNPEVSSDDSDAIFDITSPDSDDGPSDLDFDIGELENDVLTSDTRDETLNISGGLDFDGDTSASIEDGLDLRIPDGSVPGSPDDIETVEMEAVVPATKTVDELIPDLNEISLDKAAEPNFDLSLQSSELDDLTSDDDLQESEIEFDLALEDTTEMNRMIIDDTLELPKSGSQEESLEDLAKSMEESMADLDLSADDLDGEQTGELDFSDEDLDDEDSRDLALSLADTRGGLDLDFGDLSIADEALKLDFDLGDIDLDIEDPADTVAMDLSRSTTSRDIDESSLAMPVEQTVEMQSDSDEIDTKLNLAKAYIELGDNDGARSILDEVLRDGAGQQKAEAQTLIEQL
ncbi:MAG: hypothetical protein O3C28_11500 [Proteobacteria bacterium]|nr:hypothetical protein [Pseudomonadota bacterium]